MGNKIEQSLRLAIIIAGTIPVFLIGNEGCEDCGQSQYHPSWEYTPVVPHRESGYEASYIREDYPDPNPWPSKMNEDFLDEFKR